MRFQGRRVLVTGASRGIGRGIVEAFVEEGGRVLATDLEEEALTAMRNAVGGPIEIHAADLRDRTATAGMVDAAVDRLGGLDVVVNNAGVQPDGPVLDVDESTFAETISVNVRAPFIVMQQACRHWMATDSRGAIVNTASIAGLGRAGSSLTYSATKAGVVSLTQNLARALGPQVRVNAVAPGSVDSSWMVEWTEAQQRASAEGAVLKRRCTPDYIAEVIVFLGFGAAMVTGQTIVVDGGLTL